MAGRIDPRLMARFKAALDLKQAAVYRRISKLANKLSVTNDIAALAVAQEANIALSKYATPDQLSALRQARAAHPAVAPIASTLPTGRKSATRKKAARSPTKTVFVVHGRDHAIRKAMSEFLRALGLEPLDWAGAMRATRTAAPYIGQVLDKAFARATAVVVLLTPDDEAMLKQEFWAGSDERYEKRLCGQARPNVLFEAGMAFGHHPTATVLVEVGKCRPFSDTYGRHVVKLNNSKERREELADKLATAGCAVVKADGWLKAGDFEPD